MDFKIFRNKKTNTDNNKVLLAQPTMLFKSLDPNEYIMVAVHIVQDDDIVRPDRIAVKHYGSTAGLDIILKFNAISDPFSINPGETIYVPIDTIPYYKLESPQMHEDNPIKNQFIKTKRLSKTDQRRLEALKLKYNKENLLPPNVIPLGRKNYEFDGTDVRLGMQAQTDAVVNSIMKDINSSDGNGSGEESEEVVISISDGNGGTGSGTGSGRGSGSGSGVDYDKELDNNSNDNNGNNQGSGGTGSTGSNDDGTKTDEADDLGGNEGDGTSPGNSDDNPTNNPDAPCSK
tara:strand:- start:1704 stop:2570 length:867 start_codon:yes stop_codon:yes gene_type:complete